MGAPRPVVPAKAGIHLDLDLVGNHCEAQQQQQQNGFRLSPE
jgi:hypothetical protein